MMAYGESATRAFEPGTLGWTARDLDDPVIERAWFSGGYEIVEGVLTTMPPAYFPGSNAPANLIHLFKLHSKAFGLGWRVGVEPDIIIDAIRVVRPDVALFTAEDLKRQALAIDPGSVKVPERVRILVPPTLILESISPGHESHDRRTKANWYAEFGVPHYWIVDAYKQVLDCLRLEDGKYVLAASGKGDEIMMNLPFPGMTIPLQEIWEG